MKKPSLLGALQAWQSNRLEGLEAWLEAEKQRLEVLWSHEREVFPGWVAGCDEVGRGPMAGPLVAAAAVSDRPVFIPGLNDSKKLSNSEREAVFASIEASAIQYTLIFIPPSEISKGNLHHLSLLAMHRAVQSLPIRPDRVLVDGKYPLPSNLDQCPLVGGDRRSALIAAASIVAKVTRDRMMVELAEEYPGYGWERNVGYPTAEHREALQRLGVTPEHRSNYRPVKEWLRSAGL